MTNKFENNSFPQKILLDKKIIKTYQKKVYFCLNKIYKKFKKNEKNESQFYQDNIAPDNKFHYYVQYEVLKNLSLKKFLIQSKLHDYICKNISKNYLIYTMIFFRYHHSKSNNVTKKFYFNNLHYDNYYNIETNTFWIPLCDINKSTGGLIFQTNNKNIKNIKKNFYKKKKITNNISIFQVLSKIGECFRFNKNLQHGAFMPKKNNHRISLDIRVIDKKKFKNRKNFTKDYYNSRNILRPNKFVKLSDIDKEIKKITKNNIKNLI